MMLQAEILSILKRHKIEPNSYFSYKRQCHYVDKNNNVWAYDKITQTWHTPDTLINDINNKCVRGIPKRRTINKGDTYYVPIIDIDEGVCVREKIYTGDKMDAYFCKYGLACGSYRMAAYKGADILGYFQKHSTPIKPFANEESVKQ